MGCCRDTGDGSQVTREAEMALLKKRAPGHKTASETLTLKRELGLFSAVSLIISVMIGKLTGRFQLQESRN